MVTRVETPFERTSLVLWGSAGDKEWRSGFAVFEDGGKPFLWEAGLGAPHYDRGAPEASLGVEEDRVARRVGALPDG